MLKTVLHIGETLRKNNSVEFIPFIQKGYFEGRTRKYKDSKGIEKIHTIEDKPLVRIYDINTNKTQWSIHKSKVPPNENIPPTFIKGDNNDRFYIAGDINSSFLGGKIKLLEYFKEIDKDLQNSKNPKLPEKVTQFRKALLVKLEELEEIIRDFKSKKENAKRKIFIQFRFIDKDQTYFWKDLNRELSEIANFIISARYKGVDKNSGSLILKKSPISFFTSYNLNCLQYLQKTNALKSLTLDTNHTTVKNLLVAENHITSRKGYIGKVLVQVLPVGDYSSEDLRKFLSLKPKDKRSDNIKQIKQLPEHFSLFSIEPEIQISKFDVLFLHKGAQTTDIISYIPSINKSIIEDIAEKEKAARERTLEIMKNKNITGEYLILNANQLSTLQAIKTLLASFGKDDENLTKYQRNALYKLIRGNYYREPLLLKALIEKTEHALRNSIEKKYKWKVLELFINFVYLNFILHENEYLLMQETQSYKLGYLLGTLSKELKNKINSFSKQYAGNISRRVARMDDFVKLLNFVHEKLVIHEKDNFTKQISNEITTLIKNFNEQYKKDYVVAGFFEAYMKIPDIKVIDKN